MGTEAPGFIYGLIDPRDGALRYVGQTRCTPQDRLAGHCLDYRNLNTKGRWIAELRAINLKPVLIELGTFPVDDLNDEEIAAIAAIRATGAVLYNISPGGGIYGYSRIPSSVAITSAVPERFDDWRAEAAASRRRQLREKPEPEEDLPPPDEEEMEESLRHYGVDLRPIYYGTEQEQLDWAEKELAEIRKRKRDKRAYADRQRQRLLRNYRERVFA